MAITKMKRFSLLTFHEYKGALLKELQKFGDIHLRRLSKDELSELEFLSPDASVESILRCEAELDQVAFAISKVAEHAPKKSLTAKRPTLDYDAFDRYLDSYDYKEVCGHIKAADERAAAIRSETARLQSENDNLRAWSRLDVAPQRLEAFDSVRTLIGTVNRALSDAFADAVDERFGNVYIEFLGSIKEDVAVLLFAPAEQYDEVFAMTKDMGFARVNLSFSGIPSEMIDANNKRIAALEQERVRVLASIAEMGAEHERLLIVRDNLKTLLAREKASENFLSTESVVMIDGWVPEAELGSFDAILKRICGENYFTETTDVEIDSTEVPIKLKNNPMVKAFESVTAMYSMPRYNEFDPTPVMMPFYWLFFGLMVGDIGYGILLVISTALILKLVDLKDGVRGFIKFFHILSYGVILGGIFYGGAFGITVFMPVMTAEGPKAILDSQKDITTMLILSVILGVIHIFVGLLTKAAIHIKYGRWFDAFCDGFLWIITLVSAICWLLGPIGIMSASIGGICSNIFWLSLVGLALTQGRSSPSLGGKIGNGLYGTYGLANYIGDFVSYTRITALALSGAYIGYAFNTMISILPPGVNIIGGAVIALIGHALNLGLAMLGAYVHTCRLQYVEFFGKFYEGGGVPYAPLKCNSDYVHINK